jgi:hypothetical protein
MMYNVNIRRVRRERETRAAVPFAKGRCVLRFVSEEWRSDFVRDPRRRSEKEKKMVSSMAAKKLWVLVVVAVILLCGKQVQGIRFVIDKKECWSHEVRFPGDTVHVSFVVIKSENSWNYDHYTVGLDLIVSSIYLFVLLFSRRIVVSHCSPRAHHSSFWLKKSL